MRVKICLQIVPDGFRDILLKIKNEFENPYVFVTENGISDVGTLEDNQRIQYIYLYLKAMLTAIKQYNCKVVGYTIWSLLDNFEWELGYR